MEKATVSLQTLKAFAAIASSNDTRYYLQGVLVDISPDAVNYVATDGHRLAARRLELDRDAERNSLTGAYIIPRDVVKDLKVGRSSPFAIMSRLETGHLEIETGAGAITFRPVDGTFPDWKKIVPETVTGSSKHGLNGVYAESIWALAKALNLGAVYTHPNGDGPTAFSFHNDAHCVAVIMPYSNPAEVKWTRPGWIGRAA